MLYLIATPIGNLGDISLRALETLRSVDYVASEDTRKTGRMLKHFEIQRPLIAFHEHNEEAAGERILSLLLEGNSVAMVTDAGTPGISDPGFTLVRRLLQAQTAGEEVDFTMIPGPSAAVMALVLSGLPLHSFTFRGFPPHKRGPRKRFMAVDAESPHTLVFYESPYRVGSFLADALEVYGDRPAAVARELTKLYETVERGTLSELHALMAGRKLKGEFVIVVGGKLD